MKKVLLALILVASAFVFFGASVSAAGTGNMVIHFQKWDGDYTDAGFNSWGDDAMPGFKDPAQMTWQTDDFGVYVEINNIAIGTEGNLGVQVVKFDYNPSTETWSPNWNTGKMANVEIPRTRIEEDKTIHVYLFEGGVSRETDEENFAYPIYADPDTQNMMIVYFDPSNNYEENLGVHSWGWVESASGWNVPQQIFTKVGRATDGTFVYAGILQFADPVGTPGAIVYYGEGDDSKKTNNIEPKNETNAAYIETLKAAGQADVVYVVNKGDGNVSNNNVWLNDPVTFTEEAFSFRFVPYTVDEETLQQSGTYAANPNTILVGVNQELQSPYFEAEDETAAMATIEGWFSVREITGEDTYGDPLAIERIDFAQSNATLKDFVIVLEDALDNTKEYMLFFDMGLTEANREAEIEVAMDTEAPVFVFISPTDIVGQDPEDRIIEVAWGEPFNQNLFPRFSVLDNRDGELTPFVYVPKGDNSVLDTRTVGDYTIMLRVVDEWGNITEETFIFSVVDQG